jgi:hypothetical protein
MKLESDNRRITINFKALAYAALFLALGWSISSMASCERAETEAHQKTEQLKLEHQKL